MNWKRAKADGKAVAHAKLLFEEIDADGDGALTRSELRELAEKLGGDLTEISEKLRVAENMEKLKEGGMV